MKKKYALLWLVCLFVSGTACAQDTDPTVDRRDRITFGIKAGINFANVWDEEGQDFQADPTVGFAGGVFLGIPLGKFLGVQPEVLLSQKGLEGSGTLLGSPYSFVRTTTFIDVPLQLQLKPVPALTLLGGPVYSYLVHERSVYTWGSNYTDQEREFENDNIRKNILGITLGADVNLNHIVLSGRVAWDFQTNNGDGSSYTPRYKNQWIQLTLGLKI